MPFALNLCYFFSKGNSGWYILCFKSPSQTKPYNISSEPCWYCKYLPKTEGSHRFNVEGYTIVEVELFNVGVVENADANFHILHGNTLEQAQCPRVGLQDVLLQEKGRKTVRSRENLQIKKKPASVA
jgi:hypothetical protein